MNHKQGWASGAMRRNAFAFLTRQERRKYEIARELGINFNQGYNGDLSSRENGYVGGYMVKRLIEQAERQMASQGGKTSR